MWPLPQIRSSSSDCAHAASNLQWARELLHVDFTSIEETIPLKEEPVIRNVLVLQDHFSKYVVAYVVKDQTTRTAAVRNRYFGLFGAPAYLVSDQGRPLQAILLHTSVSCMVCTSSEPRLITPRPTDRSSA